MSRIIKSFDEFINEHLDNEVFEKFTPMELENLFHGNTTFVKNRNEERVKVINGTYTINSDGTVDVEGDVYLHNQVLKYLPCQFGKVTGNFWCSNNKLTSLKGCPTYVGGEFKCNINKLTSLEFSPKIVNGNYDCSLNKLKSLKGVCTNIIGDFDCSKNPLKSLKDGPKNVGGKFYCYDCDNITSLEGMPIYIGKSFMFRYSTERDYGFTVSEEYVRKICRVQNIHIG